MSATTNTPALNLFSEGWNQSNPNKPIFLGESIQLYWQMTRCEKYAFVGLLDHIRPKVAIEIGTYMGGSLQMISRFSQKVYCLDINNQHVKDLEGKFDNVHFRIGDSKKTVPALIQDINEQKEVLNFVLIDGDHSEKGVKADINAVLKIVPKEPVYIIFHDSFNPTCRKGILGASWTACPYVHYVELDYIPGVYHHKAHDKAIPRTMWGGLALAVLLPEKRKDELIIHQSQEGLFDAAFAVSMHNDPPKAAMKAPKKPSAKGLLSKIKGIFK